MKRVISTLLFIVSFHLIHAQISDTARQSQATITDSIDVNDTTIYTSVDTAASFPGGKAAWNQFAGKTLDATVGVINGPNFENITW